MQVPLEDFDRRPERIGRCPCGSGKRYKDCCWPYLRGRVNTPVSNRTPKPKDEVEKLVRARATLTQYLMWFWAHTEPMIHDHPEAAKTLVEVDIDALDDILDQLRILLLERGDVAAFERALYEVEHLMDNQRWAETVVRQRALWAMGADWNEDAGRKVLAIIKEPKSIIDPELLTLYIDLYGKGLNPTSMQTLSERAIQLSPRAGVKLQYSVLIAIRDLMSNFIDAARTQIAEAVNKYREEILASGNVYERHQLANALVILANFSEDAGPLLEEAYHVIENLFSSANWNNAGQAKLYSSLAEISEKLGDLERAKAQYIESVNLAGDPLHRILLAKVYVKLRDAASAADQLSKVQYELLNDSGKFDFSVSAAGVALINRDVNLVNAALKRFSELEVGELYFQTVRDEISTQLKMKRDELLSQKDETSWFVRAAELLSKYIKMEPGAFGFGVNLNAILDDFAKSKKLR